MSEVISRLNAVIPDHYRIEKEIGVGGMATVYLTRDLKHNREVAIKVLKPELAVQIGADRFLAEIETTANLQHLHIVPLFDSGVAGPFLYYVMPFVEGESLDQRLKNVGRLSVEESIAITKDVAAALSYAHDHGVIHRDIKPANILLKDGEALVADFGVALAVSNADRDGLTATGLSVGTPAYMSPEQIGGEDSIDGRSDVYSLGGLLYEMLAGEPPFTGTAQSVVVQGLSVPAPSIRKIRPEISRGVDSAIRKAMSKKPGERFATANEFYEACAAAAPTKGKGVSKAVFALLALVVLFVGFIGWRTLQMSDARNLLPEMAQLVEEGRFVEAYEIGLQAERWLKGDSSLSLLMNDASDLLVITSDPPGALVSLERYGADAEGIGASIDIGVTPVDAYRVPRIDHLVLLTLAGYGSAERVASGFLLRELERDAGRVEIDVRLEPSDQVSPKMLHIGGGNYELVSPDSPTGLSVPLVDFEIDRFEVTNAEYRTFVSDGGYGDEAYWDTGARIDLPEFVDRTGLQGPRDWVRQRFPEGQGSFPVSTVNWHEASAYCAWVGKRLPTIFEWEKTARNGMISQIGTVMPWGLARASAQISPRANFNSSGPGAVDAYPFGISPHGAYGMAGNVAEWTANSLGEGIATTGGSWDGPSYLHSEYASHPAMFTSAALGFRCATSQGPSSQGAEPIDLDSRTPKYTPIDEAGFRALLNHYRYDPRSANPRNAATVDAPDWTREELWIDGLDADSMRLFLFKPKSASPPYQTLVYVPGSGAFYFEPIQDEVEWAIGPSIQAGRAVLAVVLKGMLEGPFAPEYVFPEPNTVGFRDLMVQQMTELSLGIDYLETRPDIDLDRLAYVGLSYGAGSRLAFGVVEDRYKAVVFIGGGIDERVKPNLPEADNVNFAPYIAAPTLLLNGRNDEEHPWLTRALPLWTLLSEPKELVLIEGVGHIPPLEYRIPAINGFLDRVLGPVTR